MLSKNTMTQIRFAAKRMFETDNILPLRRHIAYAAAFELSPSFPFLKDREIKPWSNTTCEDKDDLEKAFLIAKTEKMLLTKMEVTHRFSLWPFEKNIKGCNYDFLRGIKVYNTDELLIDHPQIRSFLNNPSTTLNGPDNDKLGGVTAEIYPDGLDFTLEMWMHAKRKVKYHFTYDVPEGWAVATLYLDGHCVYDIKKGTQNAPRRV